MAKTFMIVLDGAPDWPNPALGGRTPLEAARTPGLDALAKQSQHSLIRVIDDGVWPESDSGAMALLSYDPLIHYTGRGPLEGLGLGLVAPGVNAIAFRVNFASFDEDARQLDRRTARGLSSAQLQELASAIRTHVSMEDYGVAFDLIAFSRHRGILVFLGSAESLSGRVTNTDPGFRNVGPFGFPIRDFNPRPLIAMPRENSAAARAGAAVVNEFIARSAKVLEEHPVNATRRAQGQLPANLLLVRDGGDVPSPLPAFAGLYGRSISIFGQIPAEAGLAKLIGGEFHMSRPMEGEPEHEYLRRTLGEVVTASADVVFVHLKGPDEPGHDNRPVEKTAAIEMIDEHFVGPMLDLVTAEDRIAVTSDHATPCELGIHSNDPVPAMVRMPGLAPDGCARLSEARAAKGTLPVNRAVDLMPLLLGRVSE